MHVPRLFVAHPLTAGDTGHLDAHQARQLRSVLRLAPGAEIVVFDGSGAEARASITSLDRSSATFQTGTLEYPCREPSVDLTVGLALLRGERFEIAVQKLTEIGVRRIIPVSADRSMVSFSDAREWAKRASRLERIVREAAEQSERVTLPVLASPMTLNDVLEREPRAIACIERSDAVRLHDLPIEHPMTIIIGPEGGWSEAELSACGSREVRAVSLGSLIFRAETAAIVAAGTVIQASWSRHSTIDDA